MDDGTGVTGPADVALIGSEDEVRDQIQGLSAVGVSDFSTVEFGRDEDAERTRALLRDIAKALPERSDRLRVRPALSGHRRSRST